MSSANCAHCLMVIVDGKCAICRREWTSYDDLHQAVDDLRERLAAAEKANSVLREELLAAKATATEVINNVRAVFAHREDVWFWQGEGDEPESLSCPMVMNAETAQRFVVITKAAKEYHAVNDDGHECPRDGMECPGCRLKDALDAAKLASK